MASRAALDPVSRIERGNRRFELVRRSTKLERVGRLGARKGNHAQVRRHGAKQLGVRHVQHHTAAADPRVFFERRPKRHGSHDRSGKPRLHEFVGERAAVEEWRADELERRGGAATLREVRPFDETAARINEGGFDGRHVGTRHDERASPRLRRPVALPARDGHDRQCAVVAERAPVALEKERQDFAHGERVADGERLESDERQEAFALRRALERSRVAGNRIRAIEDDGVNARVARRARRKQRRPDVRVVSRAHVREVDDQEVDLREVLAFRHEVLARLAVEAHDSESRFGDLARFDRFLGLRVGFEPVFRSENEADVRAELGEHRERVAASSIDGGSVREHADARFTQPPRQRAGGGEIESGQESHDPELLKLRGSLR